MKKFLVAGVFVVALMTACNRGNVQIDTEYLPTETVVESYSSDTMLENTVPDKAVDASVEPSESSSVSTEVADESSESSSVPTKVAGESSESVSTGDNQLEDSFYEITGQYEYTNDKGTTERVFIIKSNTDSAIGIKTTAKTKSDQLELFSTTLYANCSKGDECVVSFSDNVIDESIEKSDVEWTYDFYEYAPLLKNETNVYDITNVETNGDVIKVTYVQTKEVDNESFCVDVLMFNDEQYVGRKVKYARFDNELSVEHTLELFKTALDEPFNSAVAYKSR